MAAPISKKTTTPAVPTPTPAPAKASPVRKGKPTMWRRWAEKAIRHAGMLAKLRAIAETPADAKYVAHLKNLGESIPSDVAGQELADLVSSLQRLDADQVPVPKVVTSKWKAGDRVAVQKKFLAKYLASGFFGNEDLNDMTVLKVSADGAQVLCQAGDNQVVIRYAKQLVAVA